MVFESLRPPEGRRAAVIVPVYIVKGEITEYKKNVFGKRGFGY